MIAKVLWGNSLESQLDPYVFAIVNSDLRTCEQRGKGKLGDSKIVLARRIKQTLRQTSEVRSSLSSRIIYVKG
jgi:hypothetical protein